MTSPESGIRATGRGTLRRQSNALSAVTAAIVGVILNLAVWFALRVFFPAAGVIDWFAIVLCAAAFIAMLRYKIDIIPVVLTSGLVGLIYKLFL